MAMLISPFSDALPYLEELAPGRGIPGIEGGWAAAIALAQTFADERAAGKPRLPEAMLLQHQMANVLSYLGEIPRFEDMHTLMVEFGSVAESARRADVPELQLLNLGQLVEEALSTIRKCMEVFLPQDGGDN